jgi:hypothetical protein
MIPEYREKSRTNPDCELRLGVASWAKGDETQKSIKFTWFDKNGKAARGGEFPVEALAQALEFAIRRKYVRLANEPLPLKKSRLG